VDFEPWLRAQLANRKPQPPLGAGLQRRPWLSPRFGGLRAAFAGAGIALAAVGLLSGKALPVLQLTSPAPRAQDLPVATWGGVPAEPPQPQPAAGNEAPATNSTRAVAAPVAPLIIRPTARAGFRPGDHDRRPGFGPAPSPYPDDGRHRGGRGGSSPAPSPTPEGPRPD
jgi:hypothetical protein